MIRIHKTSQKGFSFVEMIIVVAIIMLVIPTVFTLFFLLIRTQIESSSLSKIKKEGDRIRATIISTVRNEAGAVLDSSEPPNCGSSLGLFYTNNVCFQGGDLSGASEVFGYDVRGTDLYRYDEDTSTPLMIRDATTYFPIETSVIDGTTPILRYISPELVQVSYKLTYVPRTDIVRPQSLIYSFFVTLRK